MKRRAPWRGSNEASIGIKYGCKRQRKKEDKRLVPLTVTAKTESVNKITDPYGSCEIRTTKVNPKSISITTKLQWMFVK